MEIDIENSIKNNSITFKNVRLIDKFLNLNFFFIICIILIGSILYSLFTPIVFFNDNKELLYGAIWISILVIFALFSFFAKKNSKEIIRVEGINLDINLEILGIVSKLYDYKQEFTLHNNLAIITKNNRTGWERRLTVIFQDSKIYLNLRTFNPRRETYGSHYYYKDKEDLDILVNSLKSQIKKRRSL